MELTAMPPRKKSKNWSTQDDKDIKAKRINKWHQYICKIRESTKSFIGTSQLKNNMVAKSTKSFTHLVQSSLHISNMSWHSNQDQSSIRATLKEFKQSILICWFLWVVREPKFSKVVTLCTCLSSFTNIWFSLKIYSYAAHRNY